MKSKNMEGKEKRRKGGKEAGENFRAELGERQKVSTYACRQTP